MMRRSAGTVLTAVLLLAAGLRSIDAANVPGPGYFYVNVTSLNLLKFPPSTGAYINATYAMLKNAKAIDSADGGLLYPKDTAATSIKFELTRNGGVGYVVLKVSMMDKTGDFTRLLVDKITAAQVTQFVRGAKLTSSNARVRVETQGPNGSPPTGGRVFFCMKTGKYAVPILCPAKPT